MRARAPRRDHRADAAAASPGSLSRNLDLPLAEALALVRGEALRAAGELMRDAPTADARRNSAESAKAGSRYHPSVVVFDYRQPLRALARSGRAVETCSRNATAPS
jgi:hypothetical protein